MNKLSKIFSVLILILILSGQLLAYNTISMWTKVQSAASTIPTSASFIAYFNGSDSLIQTEDSWNGTNNNEGYWSTLGICRVNSDYITGLTAASTYDIWISAEAES